MPSLSSAAAAFLIRIVRVFVFLLFFILLFLLVLNWKRVRLRDLSQVWKLGSFGRNYALLD
jgi:hypothetical protein